MNLSKTGLIRGASQLVPISLRCHTGDNRPVVHTRYNDNASSRLVLTLSTETRHDKYQNLTFGSAAVWTNGKLYKMILFYKDGLDGRQIEKVRQVALELRKDNTVAIMPKTEFVTKVFYPYVYEARQSVSDLICHTSCLDLQHHGELHEKSTTHFP